MAAGLKKSPKIRPNPIATSPQAFKKSTASNRPGFDKIQPDTPDITPRDSFKKSAEVHWVLLTLDTPS